MSLIQHLQVQTFAARFFILFNKMIIFSLEGVYLMDELLNYLLNPSTLPVYILEFILSWIPFLVMFLDVQLPNGIWDDEVSEADASVDSSFEMSCHAAAIMCIPHDCFLWPPALCLNIKVAQDLFLFSFCLLAVDFPSKSIHGDTCCGGVCMRYAGKNTQKFYIFLSFLTWICRPIFQVYAPNNKHICCDHNTWFKKPWYCRPMLQLQHT